MYFWVGDKNFEIIFKVLVKIIPPKAKTTRREKDEFLNKFVCFTNSIVDTDLEITKLKNYWTEFEIEREAIYQRFEELQEEKSWIQLEYHVCCESVFAHCNYISDFCDYPWICTHEGVCGVSAKLVFAGNCITKIQLETNRTALILIFWPEISLRFAVVSVFGTRRWWWWWWWLFLIAVSRLADVNIIHTSRELDLLVEIDKTFFPHLFFRNRIFV